MLNNLDTYMEHLQAGVKPQQVTHGFVHSEPHGIVAIDQKGGGSGLKETRLYLFPDEDTQIVHVLTLGDKETQKEDIRCCSEFVLELREKREQENDQE